MDKELLTFIIVMGSFFIFCALLYLVQRRFNFNQYIKEKRKLFTSKSDENNYLSLSEYIELVKRSLNTDLNFRETLMMLLFGINGETGELTDHFKKYFFHQHDCNIEYVSKEIGDIFWYVFSLCNQLKLNPEQIFYQNIKKLKERYPEGFDYNKSKNRKDK